MSGMRPTGRLHVGHLFGVLVNWRELAAARPAFFEIADLHALTTKFADSRAIGDDVREMVRDWIAAGIDPERCTIYRQSRVSQIGELHLLLSMIVPVTWLQRVPTYKDQIAALGPEIATYGFLGYPLMQTTDVAIVRASLVPVGRDQLAHLELAREIVRRFTHLYGPVFPEPQGILGEFPEVPGVDGRKMSKSYGNHIAIGDDEATTTERIRATVTDPLKVRRNDPGRPEICPIFALHRLCNEARTPEIAEGCRSGALGCVDCKRRCALALNERLAPMREIRAAVTDATIDEVVASGTERVRAIAGETLDAAKTAMGLG